MWDIDGILFDTLHMYEYICVAWMWHRLQNICMRVHACHLPEEKKNMHGE
jgi:hypothetical protein